MSDPVTPRQFHALECVDDWRMVGQTVCTTFRTGTWACRPTRPPYRVSVCVDVSAGCGLRARQTCSASAARDTSAV